MDCIIQLIYDICRKGQVTNPVFLLHFPRRFRIYQAMKTDILKCIAGRYSPAAAALLLVLSGCTTKPKNLEDLYGTWDLLRRTIINTPRGTIIEERGTPGFHATTLTFEEGGAYISTVLVDDEQQVETGKWSAEGSNVIILKTGNVTRYGTFKVKDDTLTMEFTMGFDFDGDGYPESYTVLLEYVRENQFF